MFKKWGGWSAWCRAVDAAAGTEVPFWGEPPGGEPLRVWVGGTPIEFDTPPDPDDFARWWLALQTILLWEDAPREAYLDYVAEYLHTDAIPNTREEVVAAIVAANTSARTHAAGSTGRWGQGPHV